MYVSFCLSVYISTIKRSLMHGITTVETNKDSMHYRPGQEVANQTNLSLVCMMTTNKVIAIAEGKESEGCMISDFGIFRS